MTDAFIIDVVRWRCNQIEGDFARYLDEGFFAYDSGFGVADRETSS